MKNINTHNDNFIKHITNNLNNIRLTHTWREQITQNRNFTKDVKIKTNIKMQLRDMK